MILLATLLTATYLTFAPVAERDNTHLLASAVWTGAFAGLLHSAYEDDSESD